MSVGGRLSPQDFSVNIFVWVFSWVGRGAGLRIESISVEAIFVPENNVELDLS